MYIHIKYRPMKRLLVFLPLMFLFACNGGIMSECGHVYDKVTKQPIEGVKIIMISGNGDTIKNNVSLDTTAYYNRKETHPSAATINRHYRDLSSKKITSFSYTDYKGFFEIVSRYKGWPLGMKSKLIFIKDGYEPFYQSPINPLKSDSIMLERM